MESLIGVKELREHLETYERHVRNGHSFIVLKRSRPIFRISPINEDGWQTIVDFTQFRKNGIPAEELLKRLKTS